MIRQPDNTIDGRRNIIYLGLYPPPHKMYYVSTKKRKQCIVHILLVLGKLNKNVQSTYININIFFKEKGFFGGAYYVQYLYIVLSF